MVDALDVRIFCLCGCESLNVWFCVIKGMSETIKAHKEK